MVGHPIFGLLPILLGCNSALPSLPPCRLPSLAPFWCSNQKIWQCWAHISTGQWPLWLRHGFPYFQQEVFCLAYSPPGWLHAFMVPTWFLQAFWFWASLLEKMPWGLNLVIFSLRPNLEQSPAERLVRSELMMKKALRSFCSGGSLIHVFIQPFIPIILLSIIAYCYNSINGQHKNAKSTKRYM